MTTAIGKYKTRNGRTAYVIGHVRDLAFGFVTRLVTADDNMQKAAVWDKNNCLMTPNGAWDLTSKMSDDDIVVDNYWRQKDN